MKLTLKKFQHVNGGNNPANREFPCYTPKLTAAVERRGLNRLPNEHPDAHRNLARLRTLYIIRGIEAECGVVDSWE